MEWALPLGQVELGDGRHADAFGDIPQGTRLPRGAREE